MNLVLVSSCILFFGCENETAQNTKAENPVTEISAPIVQTVSTIAEADISKIAEVAEKSKVEIADVPVKSKVEKKESEVKKPAPLNPVKTEEKTSTPPPTKTIKKETKPISVVEKTTPPKEQKTTPAPSPAVGVNHTDFDKLLKKHVSPSGKVSYSGLKSERSNLNNYIAKLSSNPPTSDWPRNEKLAFWINAYNAYTIDLILENYPVKSITDLDGGSPWKVNRIEIGGKKYSLDQIENKIIRPQFKDARIHFAVNCAAKSCPSLLNEAFFPDKLNSQLNAQTKKFINNKNFNSISENAISVSKIFEWYAEDFGDLIAFLNKYSTTKISAEAEKSFSEYDWSLNGE